MGIIFITSISNINFHKFKQILKGGTLVYLGSLYYVIKLLSHRKYCISLSHYINSYTVQFSLKNTMFYRNTNQLKFPFHCFISQDKFIAR